MRPIRRRFTNRALTALIIVATLFAGVVANADPAAAAKPDRTEPPAESPWSDEQPGRRIGHGTADPATTPGDFVPGSSMDAVVQQINAHDLWNQGITGAGVQVAVIDTGVAPVPALLGPDKVVAMVDLSLEAHVPEAVFLDTNGHGTHMAGIIAGRGPDGFRGVAPDASLVSLKVGDNTGAVDVSQVIAAIDWVVQYGRADGLNIRVLNLSYGTDGTQDYRIDPLAAAVERAWDAGIVVVVAAGNEGWHSGTLANPAIDPFVIAVGAADGTGNRFRVPKWSSTSQWYSETDDGDGTASPLDDYALYWQEDYTGRLPDVVAPGVSIESLRVPGSRVADEHPEGYVSEYVMRGSGTSQSAAVVSGAVALLLQARPDLTPDQTKALLGSTARPIRHAWATQQGQGVVDIAAAAAAPIPENATQTWPRSTGLGSLDAARGTQRVVVDGVEILGEITVWGDTWDGASWREQTLAGASWSGASWSGASWSGASWSGASWSGASWSGASWSGASWSGASWSGASWSGASWSGASWSGASWSGASWSGASWSGASWSGASWSGASWSGASWSGASWSGASWSNDGWLSATWT